MYSLYCTDVKNIYCKISDYIILQNSENWSFKSRTTVIGQFHLSVILHYDYLQEHRHSVHKSKNLETVQQEKVEKQIAKGRVRKPRSIFYTFPSWQISIDETVSQLAKDPNLDGQ